MSELICYAAILNLSTSLPEPTTPTSSFVDAISDDLYFIQDIFFNICIIPTLSILGMVGNSIAVIVLFRQGFQEVTNILLASLAINDFFFSLLNLIFQCKYFVFFIDYNLSVSMRAFYYVSIVAVTIFSQCWSCVLISSLAIERFVAVFFPFYVSRIFRTHRVKWMISFLFFYTLGLISPYFFLYSYEWVYETNYTITFAELTNSRWYNDNTESLDIYLGIVLNNLLSIVPLVVIIVCSIAIVIKLYTKNALHTRKHAATTKKTKSVTSIKAVKTLLVVCVVHLFVYLPSAISETYRCYVIVQNSSGKIWALLGNVNYTLYTLSACLNVIIYVIMSSKFAANLKDIFVCCSEI